MPSKRRTPAKAPAAAAAKAAPSTPKDAAPQPAKAAPAPSPPPPPQPVETPAAKVRREWQKFISNWYEPQLKKLKEQIQKDLAAKYKNSGLSKAQQKARDAELQKKVSQMAPQLAEPARTEWEKRLEAAQLREDEWNDMSTEEQQAVLNVFIGLFGDDDGDDDDDDDGANASSIGEDETPSEDQYRAPASKPSPPMPGSATFELVNPTSLFVETASPLNPTKTLPALSMDHLANLGASSAGRPAEPLLTAAGGFGFQHWASEAGLAPQPSPSLAPKSAPQPRPRATDNLSRQASAMSTVSSPPLFSNQSSPPQSSPPTQMVKSSPLTATDALPLGKRYIGPTILDDDEALDADLVKSKMAAEYDEFKNSLRIQMIYDFHAEAAEIEIRLVETLLADEGTKESRAKAVQEHELHMMALREQKEEQRKRRCAEERDRRRDELKAYLARIAHRSPHHRDDDPSGSKGAPPKASNKSVPQKAFSVAQKENLPVPQLSASSSGQAAKPDPPGILKKSASVLSQVEASTNEAIFAEAAARLAQAKHAGDGPNVPQPSQVRKRTNSTRLPNQDIPQITINFSDPPKSVPLPNPAPASSAKGKKGKKGQAAVSKPITIADEPDVDAEPPPPPSLWSAPTPRSAWGMPSASHSNNATVSDELDPDTGAGLFSTFTSSLTSAWAGTAKNANGTSEKKSKTVTFTDEPDVEFDAPPLSAWGAKPRNGTVDGKQKKASTVESQKWPEPAPVPSSTSTGKKSVKSSAAPTTNRRFKTAAVSEELEGTEEDGMFMPGPPQTLPQMKGAKTAWGGPAPAKQTKGAASPAGFHGTEAPTSKSARVATVLDPYGDWQTATAGAGTSAHMPGALDEEDVPDESDDDDDDGWLDKENAEYWNNFIGVEPDKETVEGSAKSAKHVRWTPTGNCDSDDEGEGELGEFGNNFAGELWMQYAISGGEIPELDASAATPEVVPAQKARQETSVWEKGKTKKSGGPVSDSGKTPPMQGTPWPKMENWLSSASRVGQSSGSARFF